MGIGVTVDGFIRRNGPCAPGRRGGAGQRPVLREA